MSNRGGRPSKYTAKRVEIILAVLRRCGTYRMAAQAAGVGVSTLESWRKSKPAFAAAVEQAEAEAAMRAIDIIHAAMPTDWRAAAWFLERRFPEEYGRKAVDLRAAGELRFVIVDESSDRDIDPFADH